MIWEHFSTSSRARVQVSDDAPRLVREFARTRGTAALLDVLARAAACKADGERFAKADLIAAAGSVVGAVGPWHPAVAAAFGALLHGCE
jgi:hypothetical protein